MDCIHTQEYLSQWMDGELPSSLEIESFTHLGTCKSCRDFFRDLHALKHDLRSAPAFSVPVSLDQRIHALQPFTLVSKHRFPWLHTEKTYTFRALGLAVCISAIITACSSILWYRHSQPQQTIVCLTPLPEVEVTGYVVVGSTTTKGLDQ